MSEKENWYTENDVDVILEGSDLEDATDELIRIMHRRFLDGEDYLFFDYTPVDSGENTYLIQKT